MRWLRDLRGTVIFNEVPRWPGWLYVVPVLSFLGVAGLTAYKGLSGLLATTHVPGAGSYGVGSLANLGLHKPDPAAPVLIKKTWTDAAQTDVHQPEQILHWALYIDWFFLLVYSALLAVWLLKLGNALRATREDDALLTRLARRRVNLTVAQGLEAAKQPIRDLIDAYRLIVAVALVTLPAVAFFDMLENAFTWLTYDDPKRWFWPLWVFALLKTSFFVLVVAAGVVGGLALISFRWERRARFFGTLTAMRAQILVVLFFCGLLLFDPTGQLEDSIRRWEPNWPQALAPFLLVMVLAFLLAVDARKLIRLAVEPFPWGAYGWRTPLLVLLSGGVLLGIGVWTYLSWAFGLGLIVLGGMVLVIAALSLFVAGLPKDDPVSIPAAAPRLTALLALLPPVALGVVAFRASFSEVAYADHQEFAWLLASALAYQFVAWWLYPLLVNWDPPELVALGLRTIALSVLVVFAAATVAAPWSFAPAVGTLGEIAAFVAGAALIVYLLAWVTERVRPLQALTMLRLRRIPIFVLLLLWGVIAAAADGSGSYYDARVQRAEASQAECKTPPPHTRTERARCHDWTASEELASWLKSNAPATRETPNGQPGVPLVFVATEGGGIRATYWTAIVLRCVFEGTDADACRASAARRERIFAMSGVSGGAVGLVEYSTHVATAAGDATWPRTNVDHDFLAPTAGWALFADLPLSFVRRGGGTDRAEVLERAWQNGWGSDGDDSPLAGGLYAQWRDSTRGAHIPLLLLNGTRVQDGCRLETSVLITSVGSGPGGSPVTADDPRVRDCLALRLFERAPPDENRPSLYVEPAHRGTWTLGATTDLAADLCPGQDVRLSTAALLAARFPYVTPSGRLEKCGGGSPVNVVDGGYFENSGTSTIVELWDSLRAAIAKHNATPGTTCVVPVLLEIDNHYASAPGPAPAGRPWESSVPLQTLGAGRDARDAQSRQAAALAFGRSDFDGRKAFVGASTEPIDRFAHIFPLSHPGAEAPLGWTLSTGAEEDLDVRLLKDNTGELTKVQDWFADGLVCKPA